MRRVRAVTLAGLMLAGAAGVSPALADQGAIDYRQAVYQSIGGHFSAMAGIIKREVPHREDLAIHARAVAAAAPLTLHLFPEGSGDGRTDALPAIWEQPETFAERRQDFIDAATALGEVADADMGTFVEAFRETGGTCKACHDDFKSD
jgi:cytochrome c556